MKIQNYTKSIKIKISTVVLRKRGKKKAEVLGHFSRTYHTSTSVAQWWKHLNWRHLPPHEKSCASSDWASVRDGSVHDCGMLFFLKRTSEDFCPSHRFHLLDQANTLTNPESAALPLCPTLIFLCCQIIEEKGNGEASITRLFFFKFSF